MQKKETTTHIIWRIKKMNTEQRANLAFLHTSPIKQRIVELKQRAIQKHDYWKPAVGETIAGEVLAVSDTPLVLEPHFVTKPL